MCSSIFVREPITKHAVHNYLQRLSCLQNISVHLGCVVSLAILPIESKAIGYMEIFELYEGKLEDKTGQMLERRIEWTLYVSIIR